MTTAEADGAIVITLSDDGRGLAVGRLRTKKGCEVLSREEAVEAVFGAGVSTAEKVTQSSGRGMGMSAVRSEIADLGGSIDIEFDNFDGSAEFVPMRFKIVLPKTSARLSDLADDHEEAA